MYLVVGKIENGKRAPQQMKRHKDVLVGKDVAEIEDAGDLGQERGTAYPTVVGTGLAPVVGNDKQQHGIESNEGNADQTQHYVPLRQMQAQIGPRAHLLEGQAAEEGQRHEDGRQPEQQHPTAAQLAGMHDLDGVVQEQRDGIEAAQGADGTEECPRREYPVMEEDTQKQGSAHGSHQKIDDGQVGARTVGCIAATPPQPPATYQADCHAYAGYADFQFRIVHQFTALTNGVRSLGYKVTKSFRKFHTIG